MAWSSSNRRDELPRDWHKRRAQALQRDGYRCRAIRWDTESRCEQPATDVDHIRRGNNHDLTNLQSLCSHHHKVKTSDEAAHARRRELAQRPSRRRPKDDHPSSL